ncbi:CASP-like protein 4A3 isoform X2 [Rhodamnia argentea]|uniref:CASP-like protein n=1 Tax=Rhodamnia argentea TaxID=178133 RepID=A0ABM3HNR9_9MYRT|nr:CASP-like protein 4A3 isoform X2 [Rhodamnia argentea]
MESIATSDAQNHRDLHPQHRGTAMKKSSSRNSESSTIYDSPHRSDFGEPPDSPPFVSPAATLDKPPPDNSKAIFSVDRQPRYSPLQSRLLPQVQKPLERANHKPPGPPPPPLPPPPWAANRAARDEDAPPAAAKAGGRGGREEGRSTAVSTILRRSSMREMVKRAGLGFRMSEMILCLISFSVMAADKTQGWSGDSFDRYKEYRFCLSVNVIGFAYSGFQAYDLAYHLITGKHVIRHHLRSHFDFFMDQRQLGSLD